MATTMATCNATTVTAAVTANPITGMPTTTRMVIPTTVPMTSPIPT